MKATLKFLMAITLTTLKRGTLLCKLPTVFAMIGMTILSGCGDRKLGDAADEAMNQNKDLLSFATGGNKVRIEQIPGADIEVDFNVEDELYYDCYRKFYTDIPVKALDNNCYAFAKRTAALCMSRRVFCYSFKNYVLLDGVSGFIYNLSYIMQVPHKALRGLRAMDGVWRYCKAIVKLGVGSVCAVVGLVAAPLVNLCFHPLETLANLTVGIVKIDDVDYRVSWIEYVFRTNLVASLWDVVWGAILYPLLQALIFFL